MMFETIAAATIVLNACVQCHDLRWLDAQTKTEAQWRRTVNEMVWRGAPLMPGEVDVVVAFLRSRSPSPRVRGEGARSADEGLPPGKGRDLVTAQCVQCHDLATTTSARKTLEEWRRSVEQMAHLGAKLNGSEIEDVAQYLARAFGSK